jgi:hypothetical protein
MFQQAGWIDYVQKLQGYDDGISLQFTINIRGEKTIVADIQVEVTEEAVAEATGLPKIGERWYIRQLHSQDVI